jgi:hypothetical protein
VTVSIAPPAIQRGRSVEDTMAQVDTYGLLRRQITAKHVQLKTAAARERFHDRAAFVQPASFTNVILLAAALHLAFRWKRRRFLEHAAFSMHIFSFVLLSSVMLFVAFRLRGWLPVQFLPDGRPVLPLAVRVSRRRNSAVLSDRWRLEEPAVVGGRGAAHLRPQRALHDRGGRLAGRPWRSRSPSLVKLGRRSRVGAADLVDRFHDPGDQDGPSGTQRLKRPAPSGGRFVRQICARFGSPTHERPDMCRRLMRVKRHAPISCPHGYR